MAQENAIIKGEKKGNVRKGPKRDGIWVNRSFFTITHGNPRYAGLILDWQPAVAVQKCRWQQLECGPPPSLHTARSINPPTHGYDSSQASTLPRDLPPQKALEYLCRPLFPSVSRPSYLSPLTRCAQDVMNFALASSTRQRSPRTKTETSVLCI